MPCDPLVIGGRVVGIVCTGRRRARPCAYCGKASSLLCDGPPPAKSGKKTCDKPLCATHAKHVGENRDLCPDCVADAARAAAPPLTTACEVWTARLDPRQTDPDLLDITRMSGKADAGLPFAPSDAILWPAIRARREADKLRLVAAAEGVAMCDAADADQAAHHVEQEAWARYRPAYLAEMLVSSNRPVPELYRAAVREAWERGVRPNPEAWARLLARSRVCLACFCTGERCHRYLLAKILGKLGATLKGELALPVVPTSQLSLLGDEAPRG